MNDEKFRINQSGISSFMRCPEAYRRRYMEQEVIPPSFALLRGTSVHVAAKTNNEQKVTSQKDMPKSDLVEVAVETLRREVRLNGVSASEGVGIEIEQNRTEKAIVSLTGLYADEVAGDYQPRAVEVYKEYEVPNTDIVLHGTIDSIDVTEVIVDLKTKGKKGNPDEYNSSPQPTMYSLLYRLIEGEEPAGIVYEELIDKATPERRQVAVEHKRQADYAALMNQVIAIEKVVKAGAFTGAYGQFGAWWCTKSSCGYWHTCPFVPKHKR